MLNIYIPNNNINERKYILDILFGEFLGLDFKVNIGSENYKIILSNGNTLYFEDHFFNNFPNNLDYLNINNIPTAIRYQKKADNEYLVEKDIPVIFGNLTINTQTSTSINCAIDIFASSFFMLTRWEENVNKLRDNHNRFSALECLAYKYNFLARPVVNEYLEMLWNMLLFLGVKQNRKQRTYQLYLTHDVDVPLKYNNWISGIREITGDIVKRRNVRLALKNILTKVKVFLKFQKDPYNTFDYLMDMSEKVGVKSYFFFMGKGSTKYDNFYKSDDSFIKNLIIDIKKRGHYIGIHPSYNAYIQIDQFKKEKIELERNFSINITFGREHYLRFEVPNTWQLWEDNKMDWDSTLCYADKEGFRCGVCYEYSVFNVLTQKKLSLKEKPLIVMDANFINYHSNIQAEEMKRKIICLKNKVEHYDGDFVFLWHNSSFNSLTWKSYKYIYEQVL